VNSILPAIAAVVVPICAVVVLRTTYRVERTMKQLNEMLDSAIDNCFNEHRYDESQLSQMEAKLNRFLTSSRISRHNLETEKERIKSLISDVSHQTKTPIANIRLYTQLLQEQPDLPASCRPLAEQIGNQTEKLNFLIQSLIKTSRLESGIVQVTPGEYPVAEIVEAVLQECRPKAQKKQIALNADVPRELSARFDPKWTSEALHNILDNAVKYTPERGNITIAAGEYEMFCRLDITDTGIGIAETEQAKIFGRFYRSPSAGQEEGVGIGLFLARKIIAAQGGYIKVTSAPGRGSTFSVFLPKSAPKI
jgi:two-component system phosphate regulon sensor histidine kinase PhoR